MKSFNQYLNEATSDNSEINKKLWKLRKACQDFREDFDDFSGDQSMKLFMKDNAVKENYKKALEAAKILTVLYGKFEAAIDEAKLNANLKAQQG